MWMVAARGIGIAAMTVWWGNEGSWAERVFFSVVEAPFSVR